MGRATIFAELLSFVPFLQGYLVVSNLPDHVHDLDTEAPWWTGTVPTVGVLPGYVWSTGDEQNGECLDFPVANPTTYKTKMALWSSVAMQNRTSKQKTNRKFYRKLTN